MYKTTTDGKTISGNYNIAPVLDSINLYVSAKPRKVNERKSNTTNTAFKDLHTIVDQYAKSTLKKGNINSLAIAIYRDGEIYHNYYGELDPKQNNVPNDQTLYEVASISKVLVGSLVARAVLENKIKLDDDIRKYLPDSYPNLQFEGTPITIKNLVTHTLGFKDKTPKKLEEVNKKTKEGFYKDIAFDYNMSDLLKELSTVELDKKPGTIYAYNSIGPELVALVLEQVYHKPYEVLLSDFFKELNMRDSYLQDYQKHEKYLANSYNNAGQRADLDKNPLIGGAYGVITTLPDLIQFTKFQLESKDPLIKESTRFLFEDGEEDTGYFWDLGIGKKEGFYYAKTGTSNGVQSGVLVCPDSNYGLVLIMNNNSDAAMNDWVNLYNKIETELINYPKINLVSLLQSEFTDNPEKALVKYNKLKDDTLKYISGSDYLNNYGYELLQDKQLVQAIEIFKIAISLDMTNANLYASLAEAYFMDKNYERSLVNYQKSLELNPKNQNAKKQLAQIKKIQSTL